MKMLKLNTYDGMSILHHCTASYQRRYLLASHDIGWKKQCIWTQPFLDSFPSSLEPHISTHWSAIGPLAMLTVRIFAAFTRKLFPQNGTAKALWNLLCIQNKIALTDAAPLQFSHEWIAQIVLCTVAVCLAFTQKNATHETLSQLSWCERTTPALRVTGAWQAPNSEAYCRGRQSLLDALALQFSRIPQHKLKWQHMQWMWDCHSYLSTPVSKVSCTRLHSAVDSQGYCKTQTNQHSWLHALTLEGVTTTPQTWLHTAHCQLMYRWLIQNGPLPLYGQHGNQLKTNSNQKQGI